MELRSKEELFSKASRLINQGKIALCTHEMNGACVEHVLSLYYEAMVNIPPDRPGMKGGIVSITWIV
jgi:hypothetical protein